MTKEEALAYIRGIEENVNTAVLSLWNQMKY